MAVAKFNQINDGRPKTEELKPGDLLKNGEMCSMIVAIEANRFSDNFHNICILHGKQLLKINWWKDKPFHICCLMQRLEK